MGWWMGWWRRKGRLGEDPRPPPPWAVGKNYLSFRCFPRVCFPLGVGHTLARGGLTVGAAGTCFREVRAGQGGLWGGIQTRRFYGWRDMCMFQSAHPEYRWFCTRGRCSSICPFPGFILCKGTWVPKEGSDRMRSMTGPEILLKRDIKRRRANRLRKLPLPPSLSNSLHGLGSVLFGVKDMYLPLHPSTKFTSRGPYNAHLDFYSLVHLSMGCHFPNQSSFGFHMSQCARLQCHIEDSACGCECTCIAQFAQFVKGTIYIFFTAQYSCQHMVLCSIR